MTSFRRCSCRRSLAAPLPSHRRYSPLQWLFTDASPHFGGGAPGTATQRAAAIQLLVVVAVFVVVVVENFSIPPTSPQKYTSTIAALIQKCIKHVFTMQIGSGSGGGSGGSGSLQLHVRLACGGGVGRGNMRAQETSNSFTTSCGSLRQSLRITVESLLAQAMAHVVAALDVDFNLTSDSEAIRRALRTTALSDEEQKALAYFSAPNALSSSTNSSSSNSSAALPKAPPSPSSAAADALM